MTKDEYREHIKKYEQGLTNMLNSDVLTSPIEILIGMTALLNCQREQYLLDKEETTE